MSKQKVHVPVVEPKSTSYLEYIELDRVVTENSVCKKDEVYLKRKKICKGNPTETFETEEIIRYDILWQDKRDAGIIARERLKAKKPIKRARNALGRFIKNDPSTSENEAWIGGKSPKKQKPKRVIL